MSKILFVDDETEIFDWMKDYFEEKSEYVMFVASSAEKGLEMYAQMQPDVIVLDIAMPKINGIDFLERLRARNKEVPVIVYSGVYDEKCIHQCEALGISKYLKKPTSLEDFETVLNHVLGA